MSREILFLFNVLAYVYFDIDIENSWMDKMPNWNQKLNKLSFTKVVEWNYYLLLKGFDSNEHLQYQFAPLYWSFINY